MERHSGRATPSLHDAPYRKIEEATGRRSTYPLPILVQTNRATSLTVTIAGGGTVSFGPLARDLGAPIFQVLQNIYKYNAGTYTGVGGPGTALTGDLTTAQSTFLTSQLSLLYEADAPTLDISVRGGAVVNQVADMITSLSAQKTAAAKFLGEIQDIDFAGAASRLNDDRAAVDVATKVLASVDKSNLLNYL